MNGIPNPIHVVLEANSLLGHYIWVFFLALLVSLITTPVMRRLALRNSIVDKPDHVRKHHSVAVPYLGGVAIFLGWLAAVFLSYFLLLPDDQPPPFAAGERVSFPLSIIFGATVITLTGLIDDIYKILPRVKIGGQFIAAAALSWSAQNLGTTLVADTLRVFGWEAPWLVAYVLGTGLIALLVVGGCNSVNLLDGLDGLAAGVASISTSGFLFVSMSLALQLPDPQIDAIRIVMSLALLGALLGFLPYNFNPATIFMGDAGSLLVGYLCVSTILLFADTAHHLGPKMVLAGLMIFSLPIIDTFLAIVRRLLSGKPISQPDREHLHHRILRFMGRLNLAPNQTVRVTVVSIYLLSILFLIIGCSLVYLPTWQSLTVYLAIFVCIAWMICRPARLIDTGLQGMDQKTKGINPEPRF